MYIKKYNWIRQCRTMPLQYIWFNTFQFKDFALSFDTLQKCKTTILNIKMYYRFLWRDVDMETLQALDLNSTEEV